MTVKSEQWAEKENNFSATWQHPTMNRHRGDEKSTTTDPLEFNIRRSHCARGDVASSND